MNRADRVIEAQRLVASMTLREVAGVLHVSEHTVRSYLSDPDLSKLRARKARYAGECVDCGAATDGTNGRGHAAARCAACSIAHQKAGARWTMDAIAEAMRTWNRRFARPPRASDWRTRTRMRELGIRRPSDWPLTSTVQAVFGGWNAGLEYAGMNTLRPGEYPRVRADR